MRRAGLDRDRVGAVVVDGAQRAVDGAGNVHRVPANGTDRAVGDCSPSGSRPKRPGAAIDRIDGLDGAEVSTGTDGTLGLVGRPNRAPVAASGAEARDGRRHMTVVPNGT
jgi:hypothetical protein